MPRHVSWWSEPCPNTNPFARLTDFVLRSTGAGHGWGPTLWRRAPPMCVYACCSGCLPAVPAATLAAAGCRADHESEDPHDQDDHGDPPECLECETGTEE